MSYTATARPINGSLRHEIDVNGRHIITTDEPKTLGGTDTAPTPHELLAATLASCVSTMLVLYAKPRDIDLSDLRVDVDYDADTTPRQVEITIQLPDHLTDDQVNRVKKVAEVDVPGFCVEDKHCRDAGCECGGEELVWGWGGVGAAEAGGFVGDDGVASVDVDLVSEGAVDRLGGGRVGHGLVLSVSCDRR